MSKVKKVNFEMPLEAHQAVVMHQLKEERETGRRLTFAQAAVDIILQNTKAPV